MAAAEVAVGGHKQVYFENSKFEVENPRQWSHRGCGRNNNNIIQNNGNSKHMLTLCHELSHTCDIYDYMHV